VFAFGIAFSQKRIFYPCGGKAGKMPIIKEEERGIMESKVTEIAPDIYRLSTFHPKYKIQFNQFLIKDDEPFLMHT
jgi:hypothetical protein